MSRLSRIALSMLLLCVVAASAQTVEAPATPASAPVGEPSADLVGLRTQALEQLATGEFSAGADTLAQVLSAAPQDVAARQADQWLSAYMERRAADDAGRQVEHAAAIARAQSLLRIADAWEQAGPVLEAGRKAAGKAQTLLTELWAALAPVPTAEGSADARERIAQDIEAIDLQIDQAAQSVSGRTEPWAQDVRTSAAAARAAVDALATDAAQAQWDTPEQRRDARRAVQDRQQTAEDALATLAILVADNPWRNALDQARLAKESAADHHTFVQEPWVLELRASLEARAQQQREAKEWLDSLALYSGLADLQDDRHAYKDSIGAISQHVRVTALYGPPDALMPDTAEATEGEEDAEPMLAGRDWRDLVTGIDGTMVRQIVSQIGENYVSDVSFREVLIGGLEAVQILAAEPEAAHSFTGLANADARRQFLEGLDAQIAEARQRTAVDSFYVQSALNRLAQANRRTVAIDDEVVYLEFSEGMLRQLDEFSSMIWPSDWQDFVKQTMGRFHGVGIQIQVENGLLKVVSPLEDSPAYAAGIQAGDYVVAIDGKSARNIDIDQAVKSITGPKGTQVVLTVQRPGQAEPFDVPLVRDEIHVQSVKGWRRIDGGGWDWMLDAEARIGYVRLTSFTPETPEEFRKALEQMKQAGVRGLVLDLRFNPGGYLGAATEIADEFVRRGMIVSTNGRQQTSSRSTAATPGGAFLDGQVVVLVNGMSASAAEIVSGALKDWGRGLVIGTRSFGKGSVQNLIQIRPDQAYLKLTTAYYFLPKGRCLHRTDDSTTWGVEPDLAVPMTPRQLRRWLELRRDTEIIQQRDAVEFDGEMAEQLRADVQLDAALMLLRMRLLEAAQVAPVQTAEAG